ncbi:MAG: hypothetical protein Q4C96_11175 [Planctomycetia bacterium]|nr:hypothetical protein [Planctomycetia bacterium]
MPRYIEDDNEEIIIRRRDPQNYQSPREDIADVLRKFLYRMFFLVLIISSILIIIVYKNDILNPPPDTREISANIENTEAELRKLKEHQEKTAVTDAEEKMAYDLVQKRQQDRAFPLTVKDRELIRKYWGVISHNQTNEGKKNLLYRLEMRYDDWGNIVDMTLPEREALERMDVDAVLRKRLEVIEEELLLYAREGARKDQLIGNMKQVFLYTDEEFHALNLLRKSFQDKKYVLTEAEREILQKNWNRIRMWLDEMEATRLLLRFGLMYDKNGEVVEISPEKKAEIKRQNLSEAKTEKGEQEEKKEKEGESEDASERREAGHLEGDEKEPVHEVEAVQKVSGVNSGVKNEPTVREETVGDAHVQQESVRRRSVNVNKAKNGMRQTEDSRQMVEHGDAEMEKKSSEEMERKVSGEGGTDSSEQISSGSVIEELIYRDMQKEMYQKSSSAKKKEGQEE